jgi:hypothetical protein
LSAAGGERSHNQIRISSYPVVRASNSGQRAARQEGSGWQRRRGAHR